MRFVDDIWTGETATDQLVRAALFPFAGLYGGLISVRGQLYDHGVLPSVQSSIPVISVGNLTVGGTGKTPVASWIAKRLSEKGAKPAIVLRGYGGDEILVHQQLLPGLPVVAGKNRAEGVRLAAEQGATVAVLDDAFQHRRAKRDADIVLVSADSWTGKVRLLPAGPWRESLDAIKRASVVLITRKAAELAKVSAVSRAIAHIAPELPQATVRLRMSGLVKATDPEETRPLSIVSGRSVLAISAIGDPTAFNDQLTLLGAEVTPISFPDHYPFLADDAERIAKRTNDYDIVVCTLKDAVKLRSIWPAGGRSLWYVSQSLDVEKGAANIDNLLGRFRPAK
ncbi:MAG TPA: tetraacyldisaccharide 4'-kinase [Gemmatimonadaceae bacterium]|nr:tetraacyldisaccharide 4'-kinase [Gemmatimonadaceae bacterium]